MTDAAADSIHPDLHKDPEQAQPPVPTPRSLATLPGAAPELAPARMVNEFAYCPRLMYLEWVQGEFEDNTDTVDGRFRHRRVDEPGGPLPSGEDTAPPDGSEDHPPLDRIHARSVLLSDESLGAIARVDLLEGEGTHVTPVDYKRGRTPRVEEGAYEPERAQICLQGLLLRAHGYACEEGILYFVESKQRVRIAFDAALVERTLDLLKGARETAAAGRIPPPLVDSPKCPRCSLVGICLPDEVNLLAARSRTDGETRRLTPARDDALPVYVQAQGSSIGKSGEVLQVREKGVVVQEVRLMEVSQVNVFGAVQISAQALREVLARDIPVGHFTYGGWFYGITHGMGHKNVELRCRQYAVAQDPEAALGIARQIVWAKVRNARTLLRRNHPDVPPAVIDELDRLSKNALAATSMETLLGTEGAAARTYFSQFAGMLKGKDPAFAFDFKGRNRRPPRDPVNAVLSFLYAILIKDLTVVTLSVGFDPYLGFYHQPKYGKPALALDLTEEFRSIVADSVCIGLINNGELTGRHFLTRGDPHGERYAATALTPDGRRAVLNAYERRMDTLIAHPLFGYPISYRRVLEVQARLLARALAGEIPAYPPFRTR